jgi:hypothetical protein
LLTTAHRPSVRVIVSICSNAASVDAASATSQITCRTVVSRAAAASCSTSAFASLRTVPITS